MTEPIIRVKDLSVRFPLERGKTIQACHNVTFEVGERGTMGLVGESGSGKTTVGRALVGLVKPNSGEIWFRDQRIDNLKPSVFRPMRKNIQMVFQEAYDSLDPRQTVVQVLEEPLKLHGMDSKTERRARVSELLTQVGLPLRVAGARPAELSAGDQQRVCISRALATGPDFVVLDEPTSNLPPDAEMEIIELLNELQAELGLSYLFISHDLNLVKQFCDTVAVMYLSQIVEVGNRDDIFAQTKHPYSWALLQSVLWPDPRMRQTSLANRLRLSGEIPSPIDLPVGCYLAGRCPFAVDRCRVELQELREYSADHLVRCWRTVEGEVSLDTLIGANKAMSS